MEGGGGLAGNLISSRRSNIIESKNSNIIEGVAVSGLYPPPTLTSTTRRISCAGQSIRRQGSGTVSQGWPVKHRLAIGRSRRASSEGSLSLRVDGPNVERSRRGSARGREFTRGQGRMEVPVVILEGG